LIKGTGAYKLKIGFISRPDCPRCLDLIGILYRYLKHEGHEVMIEQSAASEMKIHGVPLEEMNAEIIITVGGDGTALWTLKRVNTAILPINMGSFGFLSEIGPTNAIAAMGKLTRGEYKVEERPRIKTTLNGKRLSDSVNEVVIKSAEITKIRWFGIYIDNDFIHNVRADGIIVASPTGSTSYSLSVGGPILDPRVKALIISHIAPFKLNVRSIVVPSESTIRISILEKGKRLIMSLDGQEEIIIGYNDEILITESESPARFVRFESDFYRNMREKFI
jgi:Predicted sugar kinase